MYYVKQKRHAVCSSYCERKIVTVTAHTGPRVLSIKSFDSRKKLLKLFYRKY